ncbi:acyl-CoA desaturase [Actinomycetospora sp. NBRC 106378]|uniref:fatty acid desaturase family protein n=1 Tax=Actinomycetospora sp. NBRC 106378 TaxID=3032208 RepID=UPI0024A28FB7|nr:acyl-CoA desaturase [Actinomycetospora sp. NBRC 106378]GLZ53150.1 putative fatty acid desaturase [Actinomycetospora sp. NBRC 106378]
MAISDIKEFAHLTEADVEALGEEFDQIRRDVEASRGAADEEYIRSIIKTQRRIEIAGRAALFGSVVPPLWMAGAALLGVAKILENMEIGHNVMHGQWDWMNDPEIHSATWEWDNVCPAEQWKHSHNYLHHTYTNVLGKDKDVGYEILRVTSDQKWNPINLGQPVFNTLLMLLFQHGVAIHDLDIEGLLRRDIEDPEEFKAKLEQVGRKMRKQMGKDYILFPLLTGPQFITTLTANMAANLIRNVWSYAIIFCGHFPDGAEVFTEDQLENETQGEWYLRQLLGSANFTGNRLMHVMSGSLGYQIEHHLFPDLPSNRYPEIAERVKEICAKYDLPYNIGPFPKQFWRSIRTIWRLALPNKKFAAEQQAHESEGLRRENATSTPAAEADARRTARAEEPVAA